VRLWGDEDKVPTYITYVTIPPVKYNINVKITFNR